MASKGEKKDSGTVKKAAAAGSTKTRQSTSKRASGGGTKTSAAGNGRTAKAVSSKGGRSTKAASANRGRKPGTSAPGGKSSTKPSEPLLAGEALLWIILAVCTFLFISYFGIGGYLGGVLSDISFGSFGVLAYLLPFLLAGLVAYWSLLNRRQPTAGKTIAGILLYLAGTGLIALSDAEYQLSSSMPEIYDHCAAMKEGGGAAGGWICHMLVPALGEAGTCVFLVILAVVCVVFLTQRSLMRLVGRGGRRLYTSARNSSDRRKEERRIRREEAQEYQPVPEPEDEEPRDDCGAETGGIAEYDVRAETGSIVESSRKPAAGAPSAHVRFEREVVPDLRHSVRTSAQTDSRSARPGENSGRRPNTSGGTLEIPAACVSPSARTRTRRAAERHHGFYVPDLGVASAAQEELHGQQQRFQNSEERRRPAALEEEKETQYINLDEIRAKRGRRQKAANEPMESNAFAESRASSSDPDEIMLHIDGIEKEQSASDGALRMVFDDSQIEAGAEDLLWRADEGSQSGRHRAKDRTDAGAMEWSHEIEEIRGFAEGEVLEDTEDVTEAEKRSRNFTDAETAAEVMENSEEFPDPAGTMEAPEMLEEFGTADGDIGEDDTSEEFPAVPDCAASSGAAASGEEPGNAAQESRSAKKNPRSSRKEIEAGIAAVEAQVAKAEEKPKPEYVFPPISLLKKGAARASAAQEQDVRRTAVKLQQTLDSFGVHAKVTNVSCGPSVTRYELLPEVGVKVRQIVALSDDIKLSLAAADIRIEAPIPGKSAVGIEVPNTENSTVMLRDLLETDDFTKHKSNLAFAVGKDIGGKTVVANIAKMPHLLIAGATGSGKSVCINTLIVSILYKASPEDVKLIMIDPKVVELSVYNGIPHLFIPVVTDPKKAAGALNWAVAEMTDRYNKFAQYGVRDLAGYNQKIASIESLDAPDKPRKLPQIVIIVDELADLMMVAPGEVEDSICRLAQLARAAGLHLVIATQRPSVNVITGLIKANMPSRIAFKVASSVDSRTILDMGGAEKLLGKGDMLFYPQGYQKPARVQGALVSDEEVSDVVDFLKNSNSDETYHEELEAQMAQIQQAVASVRGNEDTDELFADAGKFIIEKDKASIGMLQRVFKIGFNRAARIMDQLSDAGVVGPDEGTKARKVLMSAEEFENYLEQN